MEYINHYDRGNDDDTIRVITVDINQVHDVYIDLGNSMADAGEWHSDDVEHVLYQDHDELFRVLKEFVGVEVGIVDKAVFEKRLRRLMVLDIINKETDWEFDKYFPSISERDWDFYDKIFSLFRNYRKQDEISEEIDHKLWKFVIEANELEKNSPKTKEEKSKQVIFNEKVAKIFHQIEKELTKISSLVLPIAWRKNFEMAGGILYDEDGIVIERFHIGWGMVYIDRVTPSVKIETKEDVNKQAIERLLKTSLHNFSCSPSFWNRGYGHQLRELDLRETFRPIDIIDDLDL